MALTIRCLGKGVTSRHRQATSVADLARHRHCTVWVDVEDPTRAELDELAVHYDLHPLAIEDAADHGQRPKLEQYPNHVFIVALTKGLEEVDLFLAEHWMITVRERDQEGEVWPIDRLLRRIERFPPDQVTTGVVLWSVLDEIVDGYFEAADAAGDKLEALEDLIFGDESPQEKEIQQRLFDIRRELLLFRRAVVPLREVLSSILRHEVEWLDETTLVHFQDVYDHVLRAADQIDVQRELMGNAVDAHFAVISNRMNEVMKATSSWGAILIVSTLVAGIYGMNFDHMPELHWKVGYPVALATMVGATAALYSAFKRRGWL